jgi:hypothetical protein
LSFRLSPDNVNYSDLFHVTEKYDTFEVIVPDLTPGSVVTLPPDMGANVAWIKLRSGSLAAPVKQEDDREFLFVMDMPEIPPQGPTGMTGPVGLTGPTGPQPVFEGMTGPGVGGWLQRQNVIENWGMATIPGTPGSITITFAQPYVNGPPVVTLGNTTTTLTRITEITNTGATFSGQGTVYWRALGT